MADMLVLLGGTSFGVGLSSLGQHWGDTIWVLFITLGIFWCLMGFLKTLEDIKDMLKSL